MADVEEQDREAEGPDLDEVTAELGRVVAALPDGGDDRPGQVAMAQAVATAIAEERHLVAQAGTGTGKTLAYLVPAILSGRRTVVATATKALQDQLADKDLPFLHAQLRRPFTSAILKGRSNYVCLQRLDELLSDDAQLGLEGIEDTGTLTTAELEMLRDWSADTPTGDRADLAVEPDNSAWGAVSMSARECPGAPNCPRGEDCFAEDARQLAAVADLIEVNIHLYGAHVASGGVVLPEHDLVIVDEAHQIEDVISDTNTIELSSARFRHLAGRVRAIVADDDLPAGIEGAGDRLAAALGPHVDRRFRGRLPDEVVDALTLGRGRIAAATEALRAIKADSPDVITRRDRANKGAAALVAEIDGAIAVGDHQVPWVEERRGEPTLQVAPLAVDEILFDGVWSDHVGVLTSATIASSLAARAGLPPDATDELDAGSPFDFETHALLYCARDLPDPRESEFQPEMHAELASLIQAAEGRTLALFTSWRGMEAAAEAVRAEIETPVLTQGELPKPRLLEQFAREEATSLFATMSFWQGVDVPGPSLSLVTIDKLPFPRPDEPLNQARREQARESGFATVDLPRAATLLAQGAGRLIRTANDQGVVAVFDRRLSRASYGWEIVNGLPPMRRTRDRTEAESFLKSLNE